MKNDVLKVERNGAVVVLKIDDPATKNGLSAGLIEAIVGACTDMNQDLSEAAF